MVSFSRMNRILEIDIHNERAIVQPGVVNLDISVAVQPFGYFFAPDPSSQRACTIGGNVAENAGGPHTLAYGVTTNHVVSLECVLSDGTVLQIGNKELDLPGYDLIGLLTGSEGTMALTTKIGVRLMRQPEAVKTMLADLRHAGSRRQHGGRADRASDHAGCTRNARRSDDPNDRGRDARRISRRCRCGAAD